MLVTNLPELLEYMKNAPRCDGNHEWIPDEEGDEGDLYCRKCFVIKDAEPALEYSLPAGRVKAMRETFQCDPPRRRRHVLVETPKVSGGKTPRPRSWKPRDLANAIRIAAREAAQQPNVNPLYVEALEIAASYFDDL